MELAGKRVLIMGLGSFGGGVGAARYAATCGAQVTITDLADEQALATSVEALEDVPIAGWQLGGHREEDFTGTDIVVVNPAVRPDNPLVAAAQRAGGAITSEIELLLDACPAAIAAVTGSNGKSTTAAMLAACLRASGRRTWLGGNLGGSLLGDLPLTSPADVVVLELSSFQLQWLRASGPPIAAAAAITNCTPNHLDWHGDWHNYVAAKRRLVAGPRAAQRLALNDADPEVRGWLAIADDRRLPPLDVADIPKLLVPGGHNRQNAALAARVALALGAGQAEVFAALARYTGLTHRLELVGQAHGRRFFNDSKATTPEAALAALLSVPGPVWLLLGGVDKGGQFDNLLATAAVTARGVACYGAAGPLLCQRFQRLGGTCTTTCVDTLSTALVWCWQQSAAGDAIVLSPACASFDQFRNYEQRGESFCDLVSRLGAPLEQNATAARR